MILHVVPLKRGPVVVNILLGDIGPRGTCTTPEYVLIGSLRLREILRVRCPNDSKESTK
jgi:hypothetical protein